MKNEKKRESNFELLRIISMIMIIAHHMILHSNLIYYNDYGIKKIIVSFVLYGGKIGVILFILISGYYMVDSKFKINKLLKLWLEIFFYSVGIEVFFIVIMKKEISINNIINAFIPISNNSYWFMTSYFATYLISPFINKIIKSNNQDKNKKLITIWFVILSLPMILIKKGFYNETLFFCWIYSVGAYIKTYDIKIFKNKKNFWYIILFNNIFLMVIVILMGYLSSKNTIALKGITHLSSINSIPMLINAFAIFERFKEIKLRYNKIILSLASNSLAVYLIHDNYNFQNLLWNNIIDFKKLYENQFWILLLCIVGLPVIIYLICYIIEEIRKYIFDKFNINIPNKISIKINKIINFE